MRPLPIPLPVITYSDFLRRTTMAGEDRPLVPWTVDTPAQVTVYVPVWCSLLDWAGLQPDLVGWALADRHAVFVLDVPREGLRPDWQRRMPQEAV